MEKWKDKDIHHIIGKCNRRRAKVDRKENKMLFSKSRHRGLNSLFQTLQSPHEQLQYLRDMYDSVLSESAKDLFDTLLGLPRHRFYKQELLKNLTSKQIKNV